MYTSIGIICLFGIYVGIKLNKTILIFLALLSIIVVLLFLFNIDQRMVSKFKEGVFDNQPRVDLVIAFFRSWLHHNIFFGIGLNNSYLIHLKEYYPSSIFQSMSHAHDTYLTYLVERGLIGLLLYIIFTFYLLMVLIKKLMQNNRNSLVIISILVWVANFVISFANTTFHHENAIFMLTIWAVTIGSSKNEKIILHKSQ
jgi:O-antigen ligase